ncbi:MAG TPA: PAS domain-containing protein [Saprospiraceae bacterium]|nr:PAS domain-containing protein [Saprospiraceae bacterium]HMQ85527.1 PAS domain-containing protein [Saprospiraceae bacterium]
MIPSIAVILTDAQRKILWVNEDFTHITGYTLLEVVGKKPSLLQGPATDKAAIERMRQNLENHISFRETITNYRKNGEPYPCRLVIHPVFDDSHNLVNYIAFEVDGNEVKEEYSIPLLQVREKYSSSSLRGIDELKLFFRFKNLLEKENWYSMPDFSLKMAADKLQTNTKYLSQVVNIHSNVNFQTFVNTYRVKEAKKRMLDGDHDNLTLFGIARQCGFHNKSTFYKVFKEITGHTPRYFLKERKKLIKPVSENGVR